MEIKEFSGFFGHDRNDGYIHVEERMREEGIPVSFEAEEEIKMEEAVYSRWSLHRQNVLYLVGLFFFLFVC